MTLQIYRRVQRKSCEIICAYNAYGTSIERYEEVLIENMTRAKKEKPEILFRQILASQAPLFAMKVFFDVCTSLMIGG